MGELHLFSLNDGKEILSRPSITHVLIMEEKYEEFKKKLKEWHDCIIEGLGNGLTHTYRDGRNNDIEWVRSRLALWESFGRSVMDFEWGNNYKDFSERQLKEIAKEGYKKV